MRIREHAMETTLTATAKTPPKCLNLFEQYLTVWVALCMAGGILLGKTFPGLVDTVRGMEFGDSSHINIPISVNDLIMLFAFAPIVTLLVSGTSALTVPLNVLLYAVVLFIVIPLTAGSLTRAWLVRARGPAWFETRFLPALHPLSILALLTTLVSIFAFQADNITTRFFHVILIAVPILIQVYFNASLAYGLMRWFRVPHNVASPGALIGASNFFELAVATAIALFGAGSGAALATVVGVLVEVPVMLSVCWFCNRTRHWFPKPT